MDLMKALTSQYMKAEVPVVNVGDTVRVHVKIKEGSRERVQVFEGTVIAKKHGGIEESITVRRISYGVGCEKVFPVHAPNVVNVETVRHGKVRRAKLYYLRDRLKLEVPGVVFFQVVEGEEQQHAVLPAGHADGDLVPGLYHFIVVHGAAHHACKFVEQFVHGRDPHKLKIQIQYNGEFESIPENLRDWKIRIKIGVDLQKFL